MSELMHIIKEHEFHKNFIGEGFLKPPEGDFSRVNIFGEISSLSEFCEDNLYLFYEFALPLGWKVDNENEYYLIYQAENILEENINRLKSISQVSAGYINPFAFSFCSPERRVLTRITNNHNPNQDEKKDLYMNIHNFSLPYELELLCHDSVVEKFDPKILIQINSVDWWGRHKVEGYCFMTIPTRTGSYQLDIPCYKPQEDNYMRVYSYFLGGSRKIPDLRELARTASKNENNVDTVLNRYGISTEYSGQVHLNMNIVMQSREILEESRKIVRDKQGYEMYNLISNIQSAVGERVEEYDETMQSAGLMRTSNHGFINRYGA